MLHWCGRVGFDGVKILGNAFSDREHSVAIWAYSLVHNEILVVVPLQMWAHFLFASPIRWKQAEKELVDLVWVVLVGGR